jgi:hypothetical protein
MKRSLLIALALVSRAALADKIDDDIAKTDKLWKHYVEVAGKYRVAFDKHTLIYGPIAEQWKVVTAAKQKMDAVCATQRGQQPCSDATLAWAAEVKKRQSLEWHAAELDPKHEYTTDTLNLANVDLQKVKTDFEGSRDATLKEIDVAKSKAPSQAERDKIEAKLAVREDKQDDKFKDTRGGKADERARTSGNNNGNSGTSSRTIWHGSPTAGF